MTMVDAKVMARSEERAVEAAGPAPTPAAPAPMPVEPVHEIAPVGVGGAEVATEQPKGLLSLIGASVPWWAWALLGAGVTGGIIYWLTKSSGEPKGEATEAVVEEPAEDATEETEE